MLKVTCALLAAMALAVSGAGAAAQTAAPPPLSAYSQLPAVQSVQLSPDGANIASIRREAGVVRVLVTSRGGDVLASVNVGDSQVRGLMWASNDHVLILSTSNQQAGGFRGRNVFTIGDILNIRTNRLVRALNDADIPVYNFLMSYDRVVRGGEPALVVTGLTTHLGEYTGDLYVVDLDNGRGRRIGKGQSDTRFNLVGLDGESMARTAYDGESGRWRLSVPGPLGWRDIRSTTALLDTPGLMGIGRTHGTLLIADRDEEGRERLMEIDTTTQEEVEIDLPGSSASTLSGPDGRLVGLGYVEDFQKYQLFEPKLERAWTTISEALPGRQLSITSFSDSFDQVVFHVQGSGEPGGYYLYDGVANSLSLVRREFPGVTAAQMAPVRLINYTAGDGLEMHGYLTLPPGREARDLPLIMFPHGGPAARDYAGFDWQAQAMASRGYAVFQPNFRGSDGISQSFLEAGYGEWGGKMQSDLSDGVKALVDAGLVDPARVCIVGASYGGYAAMAGMTLDAGTYRCGVATAGVSDLAVMVRSEEAPGARGRRNPTVRYWQRFMGFTDYRDPSLAARSPALQASRLQGPLLLIHGRNDTVVPFEQSELMLRAAEAAGKTDVRLVPLADEDHWLSTATGRARQLEEMMAFLLEHNPPD
ncbi:MAG: alpha/beta hydrolase family protein [Brevundimonas sp.]|uniref:alpha/beta hydrolase family protein n=1 Tax=Brevundimonas sp. TaxID=1871086 RepID=UPI00391B5216